MVTPLRTGSRGSRGSRDPRESRGSPSANRTEAATSSAAGLSLFDPALSSLVSGSGGVGGAEDSFEAHERAIHKELGGAAEDARPARGAASDASKPEIGRGDAAGQKATSSNLPAAVKGEWAAYVDPRTQMKYYFNLRTRATQWEVPEPFAE